MSTDTNAAHTIPLDEFLATTTSEQRALALDLDSIHSDLTYASCIDGEAEEVWTTLVDYLEGDDYLNDHGNVVLAEVDKAIARMRELGGTWAGGCLYRAGAAASYFDLDLDQDEEKVLYDVARWVSLEEMAQLTGRALPATATTPAERAAAAARLTPRQGTRPQPRRTTRRDRRA